MKNLPMTVHAARTHLLGNDMSNHSKKNPEDWSQELHLMETADTMDRAAKSTTSIAALPSSPMAANSCLESWGRESMTLIKE